jgi:hypothetical protein
MPTDQKITLSANNVLVKVTGGVTGVTRRAEDKGTTQQGTAVETKNLITTRQADAQEAERARKLLNKLRSTADSYCTSVLNLTLTTIDQLPALRAEMAPIQKQIDAHNASARYHKVDRAFICAPIALNADPAALTEVCRQIADELKTARALFDLEAGLASVANASEPLAAWLRPLDNWITRTKGLSALFPTVVGAAIGEGIESVKVLRCRVADSCRAFTKAGRAEDNALREALKTVGENPEAFGLLDSAIGLTTITDSDAKAESDALRAEGASVGVEVH